MSRDEIQEDSFSSDEDFDEEGDSESSSDVDAKLAEDDVFGVEFFKCYSALKKKDDKIYDKNVKFFNDELSSDSGEEADEETDGKTLVKPTKKSKTPKMTLLDHQLKLDEADLEESNQTQANPKIDLTKTVSKSFYEKELEEIKKNIEKIGHDINSESDDDLLVMKGSEPGTSASKPRKKIDAILDELEEDQDIKHLKQIWNDPSQLTEEDKYLRDYILNKRYISNNIQEDTKAGFFSSNLEELSDADTDVSQEEKEKSKNQVEHRSDEKDFDKISRIPRNSTKTIRDLQEKREKKEKRMKKLQKEKKRKRALKDADCEDIVGDLPTKFHYRETEPNDYGLSAEELLMATDEELDKWIALKDTVKYKTPEEELREKKKYDQKRNDLELKKKIFQSIYGEQEDAPESNQESETVPKAKKRKRRTTEESSTQDGANDIKDQVVTSEQSSKSESAKQKKKKLKKRGLNHKKFAKSGVAPDRLLAYGLSKTKLRKSKLL